MTSIVLAVFRVIAAAFRGLWDFVRLKWWFQRLRGERLRRFQRRKIDHMIRLAVERSPFYRKLYEGRDLSRFEELPTVDKATMMEHFTDFNTVGLDRDALIEFALKMETDADFLRYFDDRYVVGLSSGTSGNKGLVLTDRALSERLPFIFLARSGMPMRLLPYRILFILRVHNQAFENVNSPLITLRYRHLMTPMEEMIGELNALRANIVMGPPSVLKMIAEQAEHITAPLAMAVSYAEVLTPEDEVEIQQRLGVKLIQLYQASEGPIGSACKHGRLHVNEDLVYIEGFDEDGNPLAPHQPAHRMLVTNLYNELQPLIRYELNDLLVFGDPCECGSEYRVIERILGRHDDIFWFPRAKGEGFQHLFPDLARRAVITATEQVRDYQVVQEAYDRVVVRLVLVEGADFGEVAGIVEASMQTALTRYGCEIPAIEVEQAPPEVNRSSQKLQRIRRAFAHPAAVTEPEGTPPGA